MEREILITGKRVSMHWLTIDVVTVGDSIEYMITDDDQRRVVTVSNNGYGDTGFAMLDGLKVAKELYDEG